MECNIRVSCRVQDTSGGLWSISIRVGSAGKTGQNMERKSIRERERDRERERVRGIVVESTNMNSHRIIFGLQECVNLAEGNG